MWSRTEVESIKSVKCMRTPFGEKLCGILSDWFGEKFGFYELSVWHINLRYSCLVIEKYSVYKFLVEEEQKEGKIKR